MDLTADLSSEDEVQECPHFAPSSKKADEQQKRRTKMQLSTKAVAHPAESGDDPRKEDAGSEDRISILFLSLKF